jgi:NAD(P)-dependent dehydrogenase (short-subunit alcohol dehydrogenase family)
MTTVFITGGNRGIGRELVRQYVAAGARVFVGVRRTTTIVNPDNALAGVFQLDVADGESVKKLPAALGRESIDILINNAGIIGPDRQSSTDMDFEGFLQTLNINTLGPLRVTQTLLPNLRLSKRTPRVAIITSSMGAFDHTNTDRLAYRASKTAVNKVAQCLATDLKSEGIAVASIHPGWVRTGMGGPSADIDVETSVTGVRAVIEKLTLSKTGRFWNYDGAPLAW